MKVKAFKKIAIANRGEVAVRIIRACQELRIPTVLLHSEPDTQSRAYRMADECVCIGPAPTRESYLNIERNIQAAKAAGADAIHPGFGFLSENADFALACDKSGITFIGPRADSIRKMGDKVSARAIMQAAGVPVVPGYQGEDVSLATLKAEALKIGFPMIIKAAAGGGGRGLRVVESKDQFENALESAQREALAGFGSDRVFLEKYIRGAKHVEFQIFGDQLRLSYV
jgi:3-methylcrotonyl-CoA carboxylase alpha subunit